MSVRFIYTVVEAVVHFLKNCCVVFYYMNISQFIQSILLLIWKICRLQKVYAKKWKSIWKNTYGMLHFKSSDKYNQIKIYFEYSYIIVKQLHSNKNKLNKNTLSPEATSVSNSF